jgi:hypothetical protein
MLNGIRPEAQECVRICREFGLVPAAIYAAEHDLPLLNKLYVRRIKVDCGERFTAHADPQQAFLF